MDKFPAQIHPKVLDCEVDGFVVFELNGKSSFLALKLYIICVPFTNLIGLPCPTKE